MPKNKPCKDKLKRYNVMLLKPWNKRALMLLALLLPLTGCANKSVSCLPVNPVQRPALPLAAQPGPIPAECSPSCSTNLSNEIGAWQKLLILP